jgi:hypothetical protein
LYIKDEELRKIDELIDDRVINRLLSYDGYSPTMARCTFASIAVLLIKMAGMRRKQTPDNPQQMSIQQVRKAA